MDQGRQKVCACPVYRNKPAWKWCAPLSSFPWSFYGPGNNTESKDSHGADSSLFYRPLLMLHEQIRITDANETERQDKP